MKNFTFLLLFSFLAIPLTAKEKYQPTGLTVNFLDQGRMIFLNGYSVNTPLENASKQKENYQIAEISTEKPFFGWILNSGKTNVIQKAYRILVADDYQNIQSERDLMWDSGKTEDQESVNIIYSGKKLEPGKVYYWKVKTWDNQNDESPYSVIARFKTAPQLRNYATDCYPLQKEDIHPVSTRKISSSCSFFDFGKDAFGRLRFTLQGDHENDSVTLRLGETLKNGRINPHPGGTIRYSEYKIALRPGLNTYILAIKPDKRNTLPSAVKMPEYTGEVTPFRYCEIEGYKGETGKEQIIQEAVSYPFNEQESYFTSSDSVLNQIWELCRYSIKATSFTGIYIDGDRERIPYEADAYINQLGNYCIAREYSMGRNSHEYLINHPTWPTEWILQSVLMAWNDFLYTGNTVSLKNFYDDLKAKTLVSLADESGFISTKNGKVTPQILKSIHFKGTLKDVVDWPQPGETDGFVFRDINTVVNAFHYRALSIMGKIAAELGQVKDREFFFEQASKLKKSFNEKLLDKKRGIYVDGIGTGHASLHSNMFSLAFGLVPEKYIKTVSEFICSRDMACSVYGSQFLMDALYESNRPDQGLKLLTSTGLRSWYNMIRTGSTITMEAWDNQFKPNQDWNHAWGAVPANVIPRKLMGIEPLEPGFKKIRIKPQPGNLSRAEIKFPTIRGEVNVSFLNNHGNLFQLNTTIPANTTADVYLPFPSKSCKIKMNGTLIGFRKEGDFAVIHDVGSGTSVFEVLWQL
jgi:hypothetical protein